MKLRYIALAAVFFGVMTLASLPQALAQNDPPGPSNDRPIPMDSYPLPSEAGAIRYSLADRWERANLTFFIHNCPVNIDCGQAHEAIRSAFGAWANVSALSFTEMSGPAGADIELRWAIDEEEFGSRGGTLAFAFFPSFGGDVFFDDAERWSLYDGGGTDLYVVAVHEIGHALGMDHSSDDTAVMYAFSGNSSNLGPDDIAGIQRLYGAATAGDPGVVTVDPPVDVPLDGDIETADGRINNLQYYETWILDAAAGETITLTMEVMSGDLDTYIILMSPDGNTVLMEDDDSMGGTNSQLTYTFPNTGQYMVVATRYNTDSGFSEGDYRLTAIRQGVDSGSGGSPPPPAGTVDLTIFNNSGVELCGIWFSPSSSDDWGAERLETDVGGALQSGFYFIWTVPPNTYDIYVSDCFDGYLEQYYVDVRRTTEIEVREDRFIIK
jgi:hypothetical protein